MISSHSSPDGIGNFVPAGTDHGERVCRPPIGGLNHVPSPTFEVFLIVGEYSELLRNGFAVHHYVVVAITLTLTDHVL